MSINRKRILGVPVDTVTMASALDFVLEHLREPHSEAGYILAVNPEKVMILRKNAPLLDFFRKAVLLIPDGIGVVKALSWRGEQIERVPGADLMQEICRVSAEPQYKIFLYGGAEYVAEIAAETLRRRYPGINIVGTQNGFLSEEQMPELIRRINDSGAQILFIALGSPRQEQWIERHIGELQTVKLCQGVGGTFDTLAGNVKRAPKIWQKMNLEWLYRLLRQPSRIDRYGRLLRFLWLVVLEHFSGKNEK